MTPLQTEHLKIIQAEVIPMTDEQRAADHADISVRFALEVLEKVLNGTIMFHKEEIEAELKRLKQGS